MTEFVNCERNNAGFTERRRFLLASGFLYVLSAACVICSLGYASMKVGTIVQNLL